MELSQLAGFIVTILLFVLMWKARRKTKGKRGVRTGPGPGAAGAIYDMLNADKRRAIEIIVEQKAEERDSETADGNLPELESPGPK